ncbi:MAG: hypothetical protein C3F17_15225 [Bradyrhizobiaceae bacterium]|nr:MAG: hypothetical protein C3F17_15225 [Bradyrhizobiaceae bacterium]
MRRTSETTPPSIPTNSATAPSFFSSLETERTARKTYRTRDEARADRDGDTRPAPPILGRFAQRPSYAAARALRPHSPSPTSSTVASTSAARVQVGT